jgi:hypothetical protein
MSDRHKKTSSIGRLNFGVRPLSLSPDQTKRN